MIRKQGRKPIIWCFAEGEKFPKPSEENGEENKRCARLSSFRKYAEKELKDPYIREKPLNPVEN